MLRIDKKIVGYSVTEGDPSSEARAPVERMHERLERPRVLSGSTYKIRTPLSEHALYVTINDIVLNADTPHEHRQPFEIFINSKNMDHFQWIVALTRIVSAVFRKGGDITFLVEELRSVFDPRGGYFKKGGRYMPSLVAELGDVIEQHLRRIGLITAPDPGDEGAVRDQASRRMVDEVSETSGPPSGSVLPRGAAWCPRCQSPSLVYLDGCRTCLNCGDSQCG